MSRDEELRGLERAVRADPSDRAASDRAARAAARETSPAVLVLLADLLRQGFLLVPTDALSDRVLVSERMKFVFLPRSWEPAIRAAISTSEVFPSRDGKPSNAP